MGKETYLILEAFFGLLKHIRTISTQNAMSMEILGS